MMFALLAGTSWANIIYVTQDGNLGSIAISASSDIDSPTISYRSGIGAPYMSAFWNGDGTEVMLLDPDKTESGDRAYIFSPTSLESPHESVDIAGVHNAYLSDYANNGRSLFMAAGSEILEVATRNFSVVNSYDCRKILSSDGNETEIVSLLVDNDFIQAIVGSGNDRKFVRFDGQLKDDVKYFLSADVSADASCIFEFGNLVLVGCQPGVMALNNYGEFVTYLSADATVVSICDDDEDHFYYATRRVSNSSYTFAVTNTLNSSVRTKFARREFLSNYPYIKMLRDSDRDILAIMTGEGIWLFDMESSDLLKSFTASELGGNPLWMVMSSASGYESSSGSSGCAGQSGLLLAGIAGFALNKLKRKRVKLSEDPFYSPANMARLKKSIAQLDAGEGIEHELI